jgi:hypothetical protein
LDPLRAALLKLSRGEALRAALAGAMGALASFASKMKVKYQDIEVGIDFTPQTGIADSGDLGLDLADLVGTLGTAAKERATAMALFIDELQYVPEDQLGALIFALHQASQNQLPVTMVAAGLPQLVGQTGKAKSYAERLFEFISIDRLDEPAGTDALCKPAEAQGVRFANKAVAEILNETSSKNGESIAGILPRTHQSRSPTLKRHRQPLSQNWMRASSVSALTG